MTTKRHWVEDKAFGPKCFGEYNNVILNESQKCLDTKLVQSKAILNNNVKSEFSVVRYLPLSKIAVVNDISDYRNLEHPLKGKNKGCWTKNDKNPKPFEYDCNETVSMKRKQRTEKTSLNNSTLSLHISAYESFNVTDIIKQDELFADKTKNNVLKTMQICVGSFFTNPFEIPRQQEEGKSSAPEIMQFKASQKLLNPNDSVVATEKALKGNSKDGKYLPLYCNINGV